MAKSLRLDEQSIHRLDSRLCPGADIVALSIPAPKRWRSSRFEGKMDYRNSEMKLDQLIGYFNEKKINLVPPFQRGHVWKLKQRQELIKNIAAGRPIPAIFLYREAHGSRYTYNILDGKQRLESLLLFVGSKRSDLKVDSVWNYFSDKKIRQHADFPISIDGEMIEFSQLAEELVRDFREYAIPTIEITLDNETSLDEIINLFVDINQHGVKVNRFDIVKAIGQENKLLKSVLNLIATEQKRAQDIFFKRRRSAFTRVLSELSFVKHLEFGNQAVDRMWERLLEIVLFCRTGEHREPRAVIKHFVNASADAPQDKAISSAEMKKLQTIFSFLAESYKTSGLGKTMLATDPPHFYTMVTSFMASDLLLQQGGAVQDTKELLRKLLAFSKLLSDGAQRPADRKIETALKAYRAAASRGTGQTGQRETRQKRFIEIIEAL